MGLGEWIIDDSYEDLFLVEQNMTQMNFLSFSKQFFRLKKYSLFVGKSQKRSRFSSLEFLLGVPYNLQKE